MSDPMTATAAIGLHAHVELWGVETALLNDAAALEGVLRGVAERAGAHVVGSLSHAYTPQGAAVVVLLAESHLSIHTWPEHGYAAADLFTCGSTLTGAGADALIEALRPARHEVRLYERGLPSNA
jgi:S-adenosylmethionine decarboxylase